jgi:hypothetical protein
MYDLATGQCLNDPAVARSPKGGLLIGSVSPRGWELYQVGGGIMVAGKPYYAHPKYPVYDNQVLNKTLYANTAEYDLAWINNTKLMCFASLGDRRAEFQKTNWGKLNVARPQALWAQNFKDSLALAVGPNAVVIATPTEVTALALKDGSILWKHALPAAPVPWGLAVNREGKVIVTLEGGRVICFG